jgi:hypothetical protein
MTFLLLASTTGQAASSNDERWQGNYLALRAEMMPIPTEMGLAAAIEFGCVGRGKLIARTALGVSGGALLFFDANAGYGYPISMGWFLLQPELYAGYCEMGTYVGDPGVNISFKVRAEKDIKRWGFSIAPSLRYSNVFNWFSFSLDGCVKYDIVRWQ